MGKVTNFLRKFWFRWRLRPEPRDALENTISDDALLDMMPTIRASIVRNALEWLDQLQRDDDDPSQYY
jgi:hypothetical protein